MDASDTWGDPEWHWGFVLRQLKPILAAFKVLIWSFAYLQKLLIFPEWFNMGIHFIALYLESVMCAL